MISKKILISPLIIGMCMCVGCNNQSNNQTEVPTAYEELYETETEEVSLTPIDEEIVKEEDLAYDKISTDMLKVDKYNNLLKFTNLTNFHLRDISGKIIFLDEIGNILRIDYSYLGNLFPNKTTYYSDLGFPEGFTEVVFEFEGIIIEEDLENLKDDVTLSSNKNSEGDIFIKLFNGSKKNIKTIDIIVNLFNNDTIIYSESFSFDRNLGPSESTYEELYMGSYEYTYDYDRYEVNIDFASEKSFVQKYNYWE